ncbi:MAG TPA: nucleotide exchange factor GrpE [Polyangiaceae bacterium]
MTSDDIQGNGQADEGQGNDVIEDTASDEVAAEQRDPLVLAQAEAQKFRDQLLRTAADFDNYRKRSRREVSEAAQRGGEELLRELLPVFDNLERAASHADTATDVKALVEGLALVLRQFSDTLAKLGVERVPGVGTPFDPAIHEAIQHVQTDAHPPGAVTAEVQAGYRTKERLLRPALVVVAKPASIESAGQSPPPSTRGGNGSAAPDS